MDISDLLKPESTLVGLRVRDKAQLITELARRAGGALRRDPLSIETALAARERLGSTGLGRGFALPHARLPDLPGFYGSFARLARPVDFQAIDEPADRPGFLAVDPGTGRQRPRDGFGRHLPPHARRRPLLTGSGRRAALAKPTRFSRRTPARLIGLPEP